MPESPTNLLELHVVAFLGLARLAPALSDIVYEGEVIDRPAKYASVWASNGLRGSERLDAHQIQISPTFVVHSVGQSPEQARWVADRFAAQVLGVRPAVTGRSCWPIRLTASQPVQRDPDFKDPQLWFYADTFSYTSTPNRTATP